VSCVCGCGLCVVAAPGEGRSSNSCRLHVQASRDVLLSKTVPSPQERRHFRLQVRRFELCVPRVCVNVCVFRCVCVVCVLFRFYVAGDNDAALLGGSGGGALDGSKGEDLDEAAFSRCKGR
jgi:hypothetical protein